jgi:hypothetical protein
MTINTKKGYFLEDRIEKLAGKILDGSSEVFVFLDAGAIIDFEREIDMWRIKDKKVNSSTFYDSLLSYGFPIFVTPGVMTEVGIHHRNHRLNGKSEISCDTYDFAEYFSRHYDAFLKQAKPTIPLDQVRYDSYWASQFAFDEGHKKREIDPISDNDLELVSSAVWAKNCRVLSHDPTAKVFDYNSKVVERIAVLSPDDHVLQTIKVLNDQDPEISDRFGYNGIECIRSR